MIYAGKPQSNFPHCYRWPAISCCFLQFRTTPLSTTLSTVRTSNVMSLLNQAHDCCTAECSRGFVQQSPVVFGPKGSQCLHFQPRIVHSNRGFADIILASHRCSVLIAINLLGVDPAGPNPINLMRGYSYTMLSHDIVPNSTLYISTSPAGGDVSSQFTAVRILFTLECSYSLESYD